MRASLIAFALSVLLSPLTAEARPPLLEAQAGCELWLGQAHGNDPSVRVNLRLCPGEGGALHGELQWSSTESGHNVRAVAGSRSGNRIQLRDERIVEEQPEPGWRFCTIDRYELRLTNPGLMEGSYIARACDDHATLTLRKVGETAAPRANGQPTGTGSPQPAGGGTNDPQPTGTTPETPSEASEQPSQPPSQQPPAAQSESDGGCSVVRGGGGETLPASLVIGAVILLTIRRRRT